MGTRRVLFSVNEVSGKAIMFANIEQNTIGCKKYSLFKWLANVQTGSILKVKGEIGCSRGFHKGRNIKIVEQGSNCRFKPRPNGLSANILIMKITDSGSQTLVSTIINHHKATKTRLH